MTLPLYDAHNHLHDERLSPFLTEIVAALENEGVRRMVVNGSSESDWAAVAKLARQHAWVIPSFGYHPWYIKERNSNWQASLRRFLDESPSAIGEVGLDRWIRDYDLEDQVDVLLVQMRLAAARNLPMSIHCLQAWGKLAEVLREGPRPACGFVLHSYGGPKEMIPELAKLGAYFSLPGYFANEKKARQRETFLAVPLDRLLIETDAPDQSLPSHRERFPLPKDAQGKPVNHPANLRAVYEFAAELLGRDMTSIAEQVEKNFLKLFHFAHFAPRA